MDKSSAERRKRRRVPVFYIIYFTLIVLFLAALFYALIIVKDRLASYEASRPYHYIEKVMAEKFVPGRGEELLELSHYETSPFDKRSDAVSLVEGYLNAGVDYYEITSRNEYELKWAVASGDLKFATVTMTPSGKTDDAGYEVYELSSLEIMIGGTRAVNISAPGDSAVFLNGIRLDESYITGSETLERDPKIPEDITPMTRVIYEVKGLSGTPSVTATDRYGAAVADITVSDDGIFYDVPYTYAPVTDEVRDLALAAGEAYAAYMQADAPFGGIGVFVDRTSDLYFDLSTSDTRWVRDLAGYGIEDPSVTEYVIWSADVYSCRVRFTHVLYNWNTNFEDSFDMTFYYHNVGGNWLIYDSKVN